MEFRGFIGGSYESQAVTADAELTMNWFVENIESPGAPFRRALFPTPGVQTISAGTAGTQPGRAHFGTPTAEFAVIGNTLWQIDFNGVRTSRGTVAVDSNPATISSNGDIGGELFITSGSNGYLYDMSTTTFSTIANLLGKATMGDFLDGFFLAIDAATGTMLISELLDGTTWDPTQFAQRSAAADPWKALKVANRYIYLFGSKTSEVWYNAGSSPFPFALHQSGLLQYGIVAPFSAAIADGALCWLGATASGSGYVFRAQGFSPEPISTFGFQHALSSYARVDDALAECYQDQGHTFYVLNFPQQEASWAWDANTQIWCGRGTWLTEQGRYTVWRPRWHAFCFGEHRILDSSTGDVYKLSVDFATDVDSRVIRRLRRAPALTHENMRLFYQYFELDLEPGLGLVTGQGSDPQVMLRMSNDGGKTWGAEQWRSAGKIGEFLKRVRWERCGSARRRVFEIAVSDPIPWRLTAAYFKLTDPPRELQNREAA
jgi:hypothetical protein